MCRSNDFVSAFFTSDIQRIQRDSKNQPRSMSSHQFNMRSHTGGYNRSRGLEKERDPSKKSDDFNCTAGPVEEDITLMLQIREGAADTGEQAYCRQSIYEVLAMRCLQKYSRNGAGQTLAIDFFYPWTSPGSNPDLFFFDLSPGYTKRH